MANALTVVLAVAGIGAAAACGTAPPTTAAGSTTTTTSAPLPTAGSTFAGPNCLELSKAVETITSTADAAAADEAVRAIEAYEPPPEVADALVVLRQAVEATSLGQDTADANAALFSWVTSACPTR